MASNTARFLLYFINLLTIASAHSAGVIWSECTVMAYCISFAISAACSSDWVSYRSHLATLRARQISSGQSTSTMYSGFSTKISINCW